MDTSTWTKPSVRGKVPPPRASFASNVIGRKLFLFGGGRIWDEGPVFNDTYSYDIDRCEWEKHRVSGAVHPTPREGHRSIEHNGHMYIFGGHNSEQNFADLYCWDVESMQFFTPTTSGPTPPARAYHSMVKLGKVMYVFGGSTWEGMHGEMLNDFYSLNLETMTWTKLDDDKTSKYAPCARFATASAGLGSRVHIYGGWGFDSSQALYYDDFFSYNTVADRWEPTSAQEIGGQSPGTLFGASCLNFNHRLLFFGGHNGLLDLNSLHIYSDIDEPIVKPSSVVSRDLAKLFDNPEYFPDYTVRSRGTSFRTHKAILSARSGRFEALFNSLRLGMGGLSSSQNNQSSQSNGVSHVDGVKLNMAEGLDINEHEPLIVKMMLQFIYSGDLNEEQLQQDNTALKLLEIADEFLVDDLKAHLEYHLQNSFEIDTAAFLYSFAHKCNALQLKELCMRFIAKEFDAVQKSTCYSDLSVELIEQLRTFMKKRRRKSSNIYVSGESDDEEFEEVNGNNNNINEKAEEVDGNEKPRRKRQKVRTS
eukprot:TRINITY_DN2666_c0_g1_i1.p1 TRINITY_DN2666_c0_g1~~TRINITY_DN2666_c0_g1_i1.p1  ORF type:complete len:613 (-),score=114.96 TRINITY_DN2666_c0_g1_i1:49-1650(-)